MRLVPPARKPRSFAASDTSGSRYLFSAMDLNALGVAAADTNTVCPAGSAGTPFAVTTTLT